MDILEFCNKVKKSLMDYAGDRMAVSIGETIKNNGIVLHHIEVMEEGANV